MTPLLWLRVEPFVSVIGHPGSTCTSSYAEMLVPRLLGPLSLLLEIEPGAWGFTHPHTPLVLRVIAWGVLSVENEDPRGKVRQKR